MVTAIGPNPQRDSDLYVFDLSYVPQELAALNDDHLRKLLVKSPRPVRRLRANAAPCIVPYDDLPAAARVPLPDVEELESRAASIQEDVDLRERLMAAATGGRDDRKPSLHVEEQIYDSFTGPEDQALMTAFHEAEWSERAALLGRLADPRLQILGERLLYSESPKEVDESQLSRYRANVARRLLAEEGTVPWFTLPQAMRETDELLAGLTGADAALLQDLRAYFTGRVEGERRA